MPPVLNDQEKLVRKYLEAEGIVFALWRGGRLKNGGCRVRRIDQKVMVSYIMEKPNGFLLKRKLDQIRRLLEQEYGKGQVSELVDYTGRTLCVRFG